MATCKIKIEAAKKLALSVLTNNGISPDEAETIVAVYLEAELRGKKSHGLQLLPAFLNRFESTEMKIIKETENSLLVDGGKKFGPVTGTFTMNKLIAKMKSEKFVIANIKNCGHMGMLGYYPELAAKKRYIGITMASTPAIAVAHGGKETILGSNPIAISVPTRKEPITFDMGTTEITYFKVVESRYLKKKLPDGSVLDDLGNLTTDPHKADLRKLIPLAGNKGFGLAFMVELLTSALSKSMIGKEKAGAITGETYNTTMIVMRADIFVSMDEFYDSVDKLIRDVKGTAVADGFDEILIPSERGLRRKNEAIQKGELEIPKELFDKLDKLAG